MLGRRSFLGKSLVMASSAVAMLLGNNKAMASATSSALTDSAASGFIDREPRGTVGRLERLAQLDLESRMNFHAGFLSFLMKDMRPIVEQRFTEILQQNGLDPEDDIPAMKSIPLVQDDPVISMRQRTWLSNQQVMYKALINEFTQHEDAYLLELETADSSGPGKIELNPNLEIPEFARHEIHIQPGGYVGSPFAGYYNYFSVNSFYDALIGPNYQDQFQANIAAKVPLPKDGKVMRILDLGCGTGRLTFALKERFPNAEIWGVDVSAPMLRFAHMRGVDLGTDVNFRQALADATGFPDNFFDAATANILFHETSPEAAADTMAETKRVLRPGGIFFPTDFPNGDQLPKRTAVVNYAQWIDHTLNHEHWRIAWEANDAAELMRKVGLEVDETVAPGGFAFGRILATKPA